MNQPLTNRDVITVASSSSISTDSDVDVTARIAMLLRAGAAINRREGWSAEGVTNRVYLENRGLLCPKCKTLPVRKIGECCSLCEPREAAAAVSTAPLIAEANRLPVDAYCDGVVRVVRGVLGIGRILNNVTAAAQTTKRRPPTQTASGRLQPR